MGGILDQIANYNPSGFALGNQQKAANVDATRAGIAGTQASTQAQQIANQIAQQKLQDAQLLRSLYADAGKAAQSAVSSVPPATPSAGETQLDDSGNPVAPGASGSAPAVNAGVSPVSRGTPAIATPGFAAGAGGPPAGSVAGSSIFGDPSAFFAAAIRKGISPEGATAGANQMIAMRENALKLTQAQRTQEFENNGRVSDILQNVYALPPAQRPVAWQAASGQLAKIDPSTNWAGVNPQDDTDLLSHLGAVAHHADLLKSAETAANVKITSSETTKTNIETQLLQHQNDLYNTLTSSPDALQKRVASVIPPDKYPQEYRAAVAEAQNAPDLKGINEAIQRHAQSVSERQKQIAVETDPNVAKSRTAQAVATANAEAPIREAEAAANATSTEKVRQAGTATDKVLASQNAVEATRQQGEMLKALLARAQGGDATAAQSFKALFPLFGVSLEGSHRLPASEIDKTPGSAWDKLQGAVGGIVEGKPIPDRVTKEAPGDIDTLVASSARAHNKMSEAYSQEFGIRGHHVPVPGTIVQKSQSTGAFRYSEDGGKTWKTGQPPSQ